MSKLTKLTKKILSDIPYVKILIFIFFIFVSMIGISSYQIDKDEPKKIWVPILSGSILFSIIVGVGSIFLILVYMFVTSGKHGKR